MINQEFKAQGKRNKISSVVEFWDLLQEAKKDTQSCKFFLGGGGNLTSCPWYGVVSFFGYLFHDRVRIYGYSFL